MIRIADMKLAILKGPYVVRLAGRERIVKIAINYGMTKRD